MPFDIFILDEADMTITGSTPGSSQLDGVTQGDGSHLVGSTITLNTANWYAVSINDNANDTDFSDNDGNQQLNGAQTINGVLYADGTAVEAEYSLTLSDGTNTWTVVAFNVRDSSPPFATIEGLAVVSGPNGFPPFGVSLDVISSAEGPSYGYEEYQVPICFASGTMIETDTGLRLIEDIDVGDKVRTLHNGLQPVRWCASRQFVARDKFAPIVFSPGAIGNTRELRLSPQHRVCVSDWRTQIVCGEDAVLVPAKAFVNGTTVTHNVGGFITYHHIMFDTHQIVFSEGVATESFHPGDVGVDAMDSATKGELFAMFPELEQDLRSYGQSVLPDVRGREARVLLAG